MSAAVLRSRTTLRKFITKTDHATQLRYFKALAKRHPPLNQIESISCARLLVNQVLSSLVQEVCVTDRNMRASHYNLRLCCATLINLSACQT